MNLGRRTFGCAMCGLASLALMKGAFAQTGTDRSMLAPGYSPSEGSDEQGLWSMMDRVERGLQQSRFVVRDPRLNEYVHGVVCRLGKNYCQDIRAYIVRTPQFNASMAPNGMMEVWTGLLLRCSDEAQFAAIVGHEMGHYMRRHTLQRYRDARDKSGFAAFLGLGLAVGGVGWAGNLSNLALAASIFAFSREQEREADEIGLELMTKAGYTPMAAPEVWEQLIAEFNASSGEQSQNLMFASHPAPEERLVALRKAAESSGGRSGERGHDRYEAALAGVREQLVHDELSLRQYGRSEVVFDRMLAQSPDDGMLWYAKGEIYRLRAQPDDLERAMRAYDKAVATAGAPPETYRSIMLVEVKRGATARAQTAFETYLKLKPDASDVEGLRMLLPE